MSSKTIKSYAFYPQAQKDLENIWRYTAETWSVEQAKNYTLELKSVLEFISHNPHIARERVEFSPPVRIYVHQSHLIIYKVTEDIIDIIRILGGAQDWERILQSVD